MFKQRHNKPTLHETAVYFQQQAYETRNPGRKAHYQWCADQHLSAAQAAERAAKTGWMTPTLVELR
jgi:hypothetical protein